MAGDDRAAARFTEALGQPGLGNLHGLALMSLGTALLRQGHEDEAVARFTEAAAFRMVAKSSSAGGIGLGLGFAGLSPERSGFAGIHSHLTARSKALHKM